MKSSNENGNVQLAPVRPRTDIFENEHEIVLAFEMPGVDQASLEVTWTDDLLIVRGTPVEPDLAGWRAEWAEFELGPYERSIRVTKPIERDAIRATIQNGSLRIVLPKVKPRSNRIQVQAAPASGPAEPPSA